MKILLWFITLLSLATLCSAQWVKQTVNTTASLRGLSVVSEKVIWASGTGGTVIKTTDGGKTWSVIQVPDAAKLDFRDIEAFDANTAYILSIGNGESSRIYKTTDGGATWDLQFTNKDEKAFFDAIACWDKNNCIAMSDPVDGFFLLISTTNGGGTWQRIANVKAAELKYGESAFAASGTCLITQGKNAAFIVSGGVDAHVFRSTDRGTTWADAKPTFTSGTSGSGIFSIAMFDTNSGVIVGGNYEKPELNKANLAFTTNGGVSWTLGKGLGGYRSGVAYVDKDMLVAVGSNGSDITTDGGKTWKNLDTDNYNAVQAKGKKAIWAVGAKGLVATYVVIPDPLKITKLNKV
ncbi:MAG: WD40/YVTN/BNR-like repeat-containing protein [Pyrinomonadaceae bacterium]